MEVIAKDSNLCNALKYNDLNWEIVYIEKNDM